MGRGADLDGPSLGEDDDAAPLTIRGAALVATLARLQADPRVRAAALVSETFGLDPLVVLGAPQPAAWSSLRSLIRLAAHNIVQHEAAKASKAKSSGTT